VRLDHRVALVDRRARGTSEPTNLPALNESIVMAACSSCGVPRTTASRSSALEQPAVILGPFSYDSGACRALSRRCPARALSAPARCRRRRESRRRQLREDAQQPRAAVAHSDDADADLSFARRRPTAPAPGCPLYRERQPAPRAIFIASRRVMLLMVVLRVSSRSRSVARGRPRS
jgi:hypothetical protein